MVRLLAVCVKVTVNMNARIAMELGKMNVTIAMGQVNQIAELVQGLEENTNMIMIQKNMSTRPAMIVMVREIMTVISA
jgi:hypothetical protein